jgi:surfeit locus 1 family protein
MQRPHARLLWPSVFTFLAGAALISLGVWQLHRLEWNEKLIAAIESRANRPPQPLLPAEEWPGLRLDDCAYHHVVATGTFEHDKEFLILCAGREPGYHVITPLRLNSGGDVLVVPFECKEKASRLAGKIAGPTAIAGVILGAEA